MRFRPPPLSCWGLSFALGWGASFFGGIQHSRVDICSAVSCGFGVLTGEDRRTSFCSAVLNNFYVTKKKKKSPILVESLAKQAEPELGRGGHQPFSALWGLSRPLPCASPGLHGQG